MHTVDEKVVKEIISLRKDGVGYKRIAKKLGISNGVVSKILIENGFVNHVILPDKEIVDKIVSMYNSGSGSTEIAETIGSNRRRVLDILRAVGVKTTPLGYHRNYEKKIDHNFFKDIDSERKAYWLGFLYADGYNNERTYQVEMSLKAEDRYILEELKKDLKSEYKILQKVVHLNSKDFLCYRTILYSKSISIDLAKKGCIQNKSLVLKFPSDEIMPDNFVHHFMRGYFDGDGCISGVKFSVVGTKEFLDKYIEKLRENTTISKSEYWEHNCRRASNWTHSSKRDAVKIYDFLYKDATIFLKRKRDRFLKLKQLPSPSETKE